MATTKPDSERPGSTGRPRRILPPKRSARLKSSKRLGFERPAEFDEDGPEPTPRAGLPQGNGAPAAPAADAGEAESDVRALIDAISAIVRADTVKEIVGAALNTVRRRFGWAYASYWALNPSREALVFELESGEVDEGFSRACRAARFREGEGLNGRAWKRRELVHVDDIGELADCCRSTAARQAGLRAAVSVPVAEDGVFFGTMDFFVPDQRVLTPVRIDVLRVIGRTLADKVSQLGKQRDLVRITRMIENAPLNMMYTDLDLRIQYMNPASERMMKRLEPYLPIKADQMIGQSIDLFHKKPEHQRRLLADPKNLPHQAVIRVGPESVNLLVSALLDHHGKYLGPMLTWEIVTERLQTEARESEMAADTAAINQLLMAVGRASTAERGGPRPSGSSARRSAGRTARTGGSTRGRVRSPS